MQLRPPKRLKGDALPLWATHAIESDPPAECEAVAWLLLTTVPTPTLENAFERLGWQAARWNIEVRQRILKSGCRIEDRRLASQKTAEYQDILNYN